MSKVEISFANGDSVTLEFMITGSSFYFEAAYPKLWHQNVRRAFGMMSKFPLSDINERYGM